MKTFVAVAVALLAITNGASAGTTNVLIIGNSLSYFNEMPWMLQQIARSKGAQPPLHVEFSGASGLTLEQHWKQGKALRRIEEERWDFVVLQAQSSEAVREPATFEEYARRFDEAIRARKAQSFIAAPWSTTRSTTRKPPRFS